MSLTDGNGGGLSAADVAAVMNGGGNFGWGNEGGGWWFLIILFLFASGGWGNGGFGGGGGAVPYIGQQADIQRGFDQQATTGALASLSAQVGNGFSDMAVANCQGNANITAAITNGQYATVQAITGAQTGITNAITESRFSTMQGQNTLAMALQQCCCDNRAATADLKYTVATEACADRQAINDGLRDIIASNTANTNAIIQNQNAGIQGIRDELCQLQIDRIKQENEQLRTQLNMANLAASQNAQTAALIQDNNAQTAALINRFTQNCCGTPNFGCGCATA